MRRTTSAWLLLQLQTVLYCPYLLKIQNILSWFIVVESAEAHCSDLRK